MRICSPDIGVKLTRHCCGFSVQTIQLHVINQLPVQGMKQLADPSEVVSHMVSHHFLNTGSY